MLCHPGANGMTSNWVSFPVAEYLRDSEGTEEEWGGTTSRGAGSWTGTGCLEPDSDSEVSSSKPHPHSSNISVPGF